MANPLSPVDDRCTPPAAEFQRGRERASQQIAELRRRAAHTVAENAHDDADHADLLAMLDLAPV
jgi:hypothetical protein